MAKRSENLATEEAKTDALGRPMRIGWDNVQRTGHAVMLGRRVAADILELCDKLEPANVSAPNWDEIDRIHRIALAWDDLLHPSPNEWGAIDSDRFIRSVQLAALTEVYGRDTTPEFAADVVVGLFSKGSPWYEERLTKHQDIVVLIIRAYRENRGGRGKFEKVAVEKHLNKLCAILGWPATAAARRKALQRRRTQTTVTV